MASVSAIEQRAAHGAARRRALGAARRAIVVLALLASPALTACDSSDPGPAAPADSQRFPDIVSVTPEHSDESGTWTFRVTVSSPYDTPERYADGWRVVGPNHIVYGVHTLLHDHADEQPFTRTQTGVAIPDDVAEVTIEGRDLVNGFGGATVTVTLDRS